MPIKVIVTPEPLQLRVPQPNGSEAEEEYPFSNFIQTLLSQPRWGKDYKAIKVGVSIEKKVSEASPGDEILLSDEDWKLLRDSAAEPESGYGLHPYLLRQILPFFDAIVEAEEK